MRGYFSPERFQGRVVKESVAHELALNPDAFTDRTDEEILSTLVHEMVHVWQEMYGHPSGHYHNREWAQRMKEIGLYPSQTGEPGGKETGQSVSHYILPNGPYAQAYAKLSTRGFELHWQSKAGTHRGIESKTKYTCTTCGLNAWAKPTARLICGKCYDTDGGIRFMT